MAIIHKTRIKKPDLIELGLLVILAVWGISVIWLLQKVITAKSFELLSWTSLQTFFIGFISIALIAIAILIADIRKEIKDIY